MIDFATIATSLTADATTAIVAAVGVGAAILAAKMGWKFFKSFTK